MRVGISTLLIVMGATAVVSAHDGADPRVFSFWDRAALGCLIMFGLLYLVGSKRLAVHRVGRLHAQQAAFAAGWLTLVAAVLPWFDAAVVERFSAHMAQHELMMLVGAPLVMAGRPLSVCLWAFPHRWRLRLAAPLQHGTVARAVRLLTAPAVAWALHGAVVWVWHLPALYELALGNEFAHAVQHAMFVGTSILFWWGLLYGRYGRAGYGAAVFYVFTTALHTGILGALFTFAHSPLYGEYASVAGAMGGDALADQQLAGLMMWIPAGAILTMIGVALFAAWLGEAERRARVSGYSVPSPPRRQ